jgi:hypothetical protein
MFGLFTKNLDTMEKPTRKNTKSVGELDVRRIEKQELSKYLGGNQPEPEKKKRRNMFLDLFVPGPCEGDLPQ